MARRYSKAKRGSSKKRVNKKRKTLRGGGKSPGKYFQGGGKF